MLKPKARDKKMYKLVKVSE
ncbi:hypothetical protein IEO21_11088 [Rhodonia placenta]|uniref:Uncharacterized protein n=1 Tax=Rhodonia placenta TaxID=104341 RepID=A0A8H7NR70_9APHY|nr:hypothetical protein IEO21_11088 [Postia placenta]